MPNAPRTHRPRLLGGLTPKCHDHRKKTAERGYGNRWTRASKHYRQQHPLCAKCQRGGRIVAATCVDHIVPHRGDYDLMWDVSNWQGLCDGCHARKTGKGE